MTNQQDQAEQFVNYATGTAFSISLSSAQIRMLYWINERDLHVYSWGWAQTTINSLARRGLVYRTIDSAVLWNLTKPGELVLELCQLCALPPQAEIDAHVQLSDHIAQHIERNRPHPRRRSEDHA